MSIYIHVIPLTVARVAHWLEERRKGLVILTSRVRTPLRDAGVSPSDETV
jgi:hypothetical protein